ncbi:hypothetical protein O6H91_03G017400 [Diphasiastrum complanatum]|uniref:Uncharacterized protein n=2 Tax=Diphasiastrum complanatum TaxID=34168 RepID=A0ACC2E3Y9_DIPCM|nr:hypothetical protein O6H91_03G017400 [Diphasiastrum complanatum]KAJ7561186.1 hypothetical protein O6H91_03G017400 [Diphasiastrum complanatum]
MQNSGNSQLPHGGSLIGQIGGAISNILAPHSSAPAGSIQIKGTIIVQKTNILDVVNTGESLVDKAADFRGRKVNLQLVSVEAEPVTNTGKRSDEASVQNWFRAFDGISVGDITYTINFNVDKNFGVPGAFIIRNHHVNEFYLKSLSLELPDQSTIVFICNSWVYNVSKYTSDRIFFSNRYYLPSDTPQGLLTLRQQELINLRGDGTGEREEWDRIYDYATYNDMGFPDFSKQLSRPVLGGSNELPYPRRCRTGRKPSAADPNSESLTPIWKLIYIPRDERFSVVKNSDFLGDALKAIVHTLIPAIESFYLENNQFDSLKEVKDMYDQGINLTGCLPPNLPKAEQPYFLTPFELINELTDTTGGDPSLLQYPVPQVIAKDELAWILDKEFARQVLAGLNPMTIQSLKVFPPTSALDPATYGPQTSAITASHLEPQLESLTLQQALDQDKLFIVDYHDIYLPYLTKINAQTGVQAYASRTIFFLTAEGTLKPIAIELTLPASNSIVASSLNRVFTPPLSGPKDWLWELAKVHVATNDCGYHQLVSHWLTTHAVIEPVVIATHRQLSALHPLNIFLLPHFKDTLAINSMARKLLINAGSIIERTFSTGGYSMEMSAVAYRELWRFDQQGLPGDLISRGIAVPDPSAKYGLRLLIADYPFAVDGLEIWDATETYVQDYVNVYYKDDGAVLADPELQLWWSEVINLGHADKKAERWWPQATTKSDLVGILTTIIWISSAHHAAVNFGQYAYAGYMPNHPTITRRLIPEKGNKEYAELLQDPEKFLLSSINGRIQAAIGLSTIELLAKHSKEEEYLGYRITNWTDNQDAVAAVSGFSKRLAQIEQLISQRNLDLTLKNRSGPAGVPYTLLFPSSKPGLTGAGIPNSISI